MKSFKTYLSEAFGEGTKTGDRDSTKFEETITKNIEMFLHGRQNQEYKDLAVEHYNGDMAKYYSDVKITNPQNSKIIWIEVKKDKNACLGSPTFKYYDREWHISSKNQDNPLSNYYLKLLNENSQKFINHCKRKLGDDFYLPEDMVDIIDSWRKSGELTDTEKDVNFITEKIPIEDFGKKIAQYYQTVKDEPVYYIQVDDNLYIIDKRYNPLGLKTHDGKDLKSIDEVYLNGRIQFRAKGVEKIVDGKKKYFYSIVVDVKQTAKDNLNNNEHKEETPVDDTPYICSFKSADKFPTTILK